MSEPATLELLIQIRDELAGLNRTKAGIQGVKKEAEGLGAIFRQGLGIGTGMQIATGAIALLKNTLSATVGEAFRMAGEIKDGSDALNISARAYQVVKLELAAAGVEMGRFAMAIGEQTQSLGDARDTASAAAGAYRTLGLNAKALEQLSPEQRVLAVARATLNATDKTIAFQAAGQLLGSRGIRQLVNGLGNLAENFDGAAASAQNAGKVMSEDTAEQLDRIAKAWSGFFKLILPAQTGGLITALLNPFENSVGAIMARDAERAKKRNAEPGGDIPTLPLEKTTAWREKDLALMRAQSAVALAQGDTLQAETVQRSNLVSALKKQLEVEEALLKLAKETPLVGVENQHDRDKLIAQLQATIAGLQQQKNQIQVRDVGGWAKRSQDFANRNTEANINFMTAGGGAQAGMMDFLIGLGSTGQMVASSLQGSLGTAMGSLTHDIWEAQKGTQKWSDTFRNLGDIAGRMLTEMLVKMLMVQAVQGALGLFGIGAKSPGKVTAAGGGTFVTKGPTHFTVGDNPGGVELVSVLPISGVGRTTVNGTAMRMAGGGSALVAGGAAGAAMGGGDTIHVHNQFNGGVSREEVLGLVPMIVEASKAGVSDARRRHRGGHRS